MSSKYRSLESIIREVAGKSVVPNQGDATTPADLSARGCEQESGKKKKKLKEASASPNLLTRNPLMKYTNPLDTLPLANNEPETPSLKLNGGDGSTIPFELPKLPKKPVDTQMDKSVTKVVPAPTPAPKPVEKPTSDTVTPKQPSFQTPSSLEKLTADIMSKPADTLKSNVPATMPTDGKTVAGGVVLPAPVASVTPELALAARYGPAAIAAGMGSLLGKKAFDASFPSPATQPQNFTGQKQATPPSSPAIAPNQVSPSAPTDVLGTNGQAGNLNHHAKAAQTVIDRAQDAIDRATTSAVGVPSSAMTQTPSSSRAGPSQKTQDTLNQATPSAVGVAPLNRSITPMNRATSSAVGIPSTAMTQTPASSRDGQSQKTQDVMNQATPSAAGVAPLNRSILPMNKATSSAVGVPSTAMIQTPSSSRTGPSQKTQDVMNQATSSAVGIAPNIDSGRVPNPTVVTRPKAIDKYTKPLDSLPTSAPDVEAALAKQPSGVVRKDEPLNQAVPSAVGVAPSIDKQIKAAPDSDLNRVVKSLTGQETPAEREAYLKSLQAAKEQGRAPGETDFIDSLAKYLNPSAAGALAPQLDKALGDIKDETATGGPSMWDKIKEKLNNNKGLLLGLGGVAGLVGLSKFIKNLSDKWGSHELAAGRSNAGNPNPTYAPHGKITGMPTRRAMERIKGMKEEVEENDRIRRGVEYVARREGDRKTKDKTGRQSAVRTRIEEEFPWVEIAKLAVKEKMRRDRLRKQQQQKLTPGASQTDVNTQPQITPPPQDSR